MFHSEIKCKSTSKVAIKDLVKMNSPENILNDAKRSETLTKLRSLINLDDARYVSLCDSLLNNLTNYLQLLPETNNNFYTQVGGLLEHALYRTQASMELFKKFVILDESLAFSEDQKLWQYALYSASLLKNIGKLYVDYQINLYDANGYFLSLWNPLLNPLNSIGNYFDYTFNNVTELTFRQRVNLLLAKNIMPQVGFSWIASDPKVLEAWLALLQDDFRSAGTLGAILIRADAIAIQRYFNEYVIKYKIGKYKPTGTFRSDILDTVPDIDQHLGLTFLQWLMQALENQKMVINQVPLLLVPGGMLITEEMYRLFIQENPNYKNWLAVQKGFLSLGLHSRNMDGTSGSRFEQNNTQQMHSGDVFIDYAQVLPESVKVNDLSTGKIVNVSAIDLAFIALHNAHFTKIASAVQTPMLSHLSPTGNWSVPEPAKPLLNLGSKFNG